MNKFASRKPRFSSQKAKRNTLKTKKKAHKASLVLSKSTQQRLTTRSKNEGIKTKNLFRLTLATTTKQSGLEMDDSPNHSARNQLKSAYRTYTSGFNFSTKQSKKDRNSSAKICLNLEANTQRLSKSKTGEFKKLDRGILKKSPMNKEFVDSNHRKGFYAHYRAERLSTKNSAKSYLKGTMTSMLRKNENELHYTVKRRRRLDSNHSMKPINISKTIEEREQREIIQKMLKTQRAGGKKIHQQINLVPLYCVDPENRVSPSNATEIGSKHFYSPRVGSSENLALSRKSLLPSGANDVEFAPPHLSERNPDLAMSRMGLESKNSKNAATTKNNDSFQFQHPALPPARLFTKRAYSKMEKFSSEKPKPQTARPMKISNISFLFDKKELIKPIKATTFEPMKPKEKADSQTQSLRQVKSILESNNFPKIQNKIFGVLDSMKLGLKERAKVKHKIQKYKEEETIVHLNEKICDFIDSFQYNKVCHERNDCKMILEWIQKMKNKYHKESTKFDRIEDYFIGMKDILAFSNRQLIVSESKRCKEKALLLEELYSENVNYFNSFMEYLSLFLIQLDEQHFEEIRKIEYEFADKLAEQKLIYNELFKRFGELRERLKLVEWRNQVLRGKLANDFIVLKSLRRDFSHSEDSLKIARDENYRITEILNTLSNEIEKMSEKSSDSEKKKKIFLDSLTEKLAEINKVKLAYKDEQDHLNLIKKIDDRKRELNQLTALEKKQLHGKLAKFIDEDDLENYLMRNKQIETEDIERPYMRVAWCQAGPDGYEDHAAQVEIKKCYKCKQYRMEMMKMLIKRKGIEKRFENLKEHYNNMKIDLKDYMQRFERERNKNQDQILFSPVLSSQNTYNFAEDNKQIDFQLVVQEIQKEMGNKDGDGKHASGSKTERDRLKTRKSQGGDLDSGDDGEVSDELRRRRTLSHTGRESIDEDGDFLGPYGLGRRRIRGFDLRENLSAQNNMGVDVVGETSFETSMSQSRRYIKKRRNRDPSHFRPKKGAGEDESDLKRLKATRSHSQNLLQRGNTFASMARRSEFGDNHLSEIGENSSRLNDFGERRRSRMSVGQYHINNADQVIAQETSDFFVDLTISEGYILSFLEQMETSRAGLSSKTSVRLRDVFLNLKKRTTKLSEDDSSYKELTEKLERYSKLIKKFGISLHKPRKSGFDSGGKNTPDKRKRSKYSKFNKYSKVNKTSDRLKARSISHKFLRGNVNFTEKQLIPVATALFSEVLQDVKDNRLPKKSQLIRDKTLLKQIFKVYNDYCSTKKINSKSIAFKIYVFKYLYFQVSHHKLLIKNYKQVRTQRNKR